MADTLRSLAGARFKTADVISALHKPLTPEERVLDRYVFLPHARTGIAAALVTPFAWTLPVRATVNMRVPVVDDRGGIDAEMTVHVYGPADVIEIDQRQVIRAFPKADAVDAEVDDLVHVEFDRPDLPWLFTPAGPDANGHLVPWITLVVAERRHVEWGLEKVQSAHALLIDSDSLTVGSGYAGSQTTRTGAYDPDATGNNVIRAALIASNTTAPGSPPSWAMTATPLREDNRDTYLYFGDPIDAATAERYGLFNKVVAQEKVFEEAMVWALRLADGPNFALGMTKELLNGELNADLNGALDNEARAQAVCMQTKDFREAYDAFVAKRPARFIGR